MVDLYDLAEDLEVWPWPLPANTRRSYDNMVKKTELDNGYTETIAQDRLGARVTLSLSYENRPEVIQKMEDFLMKHYNADCKSFKVKDRINGRLCKYIVKIFTPPTMTQKNALESSISFKLEEVRSLV
ncbi:hypothetical protein CKF54_00495 [Psittacicella hinzii]|uniref:Uncharacterized protein n=1 Tax=Psittacicella hinzii TaxID=2028575 RepID=A0A3A1YBA4_9GAMM|nr:hypothetical protein CKF54_00495 [Psittacicella hinzii]